MKSSFLAFAYHGIEYQHKGTESRFRLIAVDGEILVNFRAVIRERAFRTVQGYISVRNQPLSVSVLEHFVKRMG